MGLIDKLNFNEKGLMPCVIQDDKTNRVLTLCYMNKEALQKSFEKGKMFVFRRSRGRLMLKGEISGCIQLIESVYIDCESNSLLFKVEQIRAACHKGYFTCYFRQVDKNGNEKIVEERVFDPKDVYKEYKAK